MSNRLKRFNHELVLYALFYNFVMQMKFSLGNIYFNNISNSSINGCILRVIIS